MKYSKSIIEKNIGKNAAELVDSGICPTCFDRQTNGSVFGDCSKDVVYFDKDIECTFVHNPRAKGHLIISTQKHYHDVAECPDRLNKKIIVYSSFFCRAIKEVFNAERVYLCTMSDGPMNHYHMQLIPRYSNEERGSKNFVKPRLPYVYDKEKIDKLRKMVQSFTRKKVIYN